MCICIHLHIHTYICAAARGREQGRDSEQGRGRTADTRTAGIDFQATGFAGSAGIPASAGFAGIAGLAGIAGSAGNAGWLADFLASLRPSTPTCAGTARAPTPEVLSAPPWPPPARLSARRDADGCW